MVNEIIKILILHDSLQEDPETIITCKEEQRFARFVDFDILLAQNFRTHLKSAAFGLRRLRFRLAFALNGYVE